MKNIVGLRVRKARMEHKPAMTQEELAAKLQLSGLDLSRTAVAKIEIGYREVSDLELRELSRVLNVSADWLLNIGEGHEDND